MKNTIYIVGDVHGLTRKYIELVKDHKYSIALGDIGGNYPDIEDALPSKNHRLLAGNHERFDMIDEVKHFLGDFGEWKVPKYPKMFFVRGAWSIDRKFQHADHREELSYSQGQKALAAYRAFKPDVMFTHDAPKEIVDHVSNPEVWNSYGWSEPQNNLTQELLQQCFEAHQPKLWFFGHHHKTWSMEMKLSTHSTWTTFHCLSELEVKELLPDLTVTQVALGNKKRMGSM